MSHEVSCVTCTYVNHGARSHCEMCGTSLASSFSASKGAGLPRVVDPPTMMTRSASKKSAEFGDQAKAPKRKRPAKGGKEEKGSPAKPEAKPETDSDEIYGVLSRSHAAKDSEQPSVFLRFVANGLAGDAEVIALLERVRKAEQEAQEAEDALAAFSDGDEAEADCEKQPTPGKPTPAEAAAWAEDIRAMNHRPAGSAAIAAH